MLFVEYLIACFIICPKEGKVVPILPFLTKQRLDLGPKRPVVVIADGARWIKTQQARHFPQATCILDWAHLWREVSYAIVVAARARSLSPRERDYQKKRYLPPNCSMH
jgi:hypothetical protein